MYTLLGILLSRPPQLATLFQERKLTEYSVERSRIEGFQYQNVRALMQTVRPHSGLCLDVFLLRDTLYFLV